MYFFLSLEERSPLSKMYQQIEISNKNDTLPFFSLGGILDGTLAVSFRLILLKIDKSFSSKLVYFIWYI